MVAFEDGEECVSAVCVDFVAVDRPAGRGGGIDAPHGYF